MKKTKTIVYLKADEKEIIRQLSQLKETSISYYIASLIREDLDNLIREIAMADFTN